MSVLLVILLVLILVGVLPTWPYNSNWGYGPTSWIVLLLAIVLILAILGKI